MNDDIYSKLKNEGVQALTTEELLRAVCPRLTEQDAKTIFNNMVSKSGEMFIESMKQDITSKTAALVCALEIAHRFPEPIQTREVIAGPKDVLPYVQQYKYSEQENLVVLTLSGSNRVIGIHTITTGILDNCQAHPREIFKHAVRDNAGGILLVHNHPSGRLVASLQDIRMTAEIKKCGELMGIPLLDHLIIGPGDVAYATVPDED